MLDPQDRFIAAVAEWVSDAYYAEGHLYLATETLDQIASERNVQDADARAALLLLDNNGFLSRGDGGWHYEDGIGLLLAFEETQRPVAWSRNPLRREILRAAQQAFGRGEGSIHYDEADDQFVAVPWAEAMAASLVLEHLGRVDVQPFMGHSFDIAISSAGLQLSRSAEQLAAALPGTAAEDETHTADVAHDAIPGLVLDVEQLLNEREWSSAARELERGDDQLRQGHWIDAVREYYSALESGLKHRLYELDVSHRDGAALRDLAKLAASHHALPLNYQALFTFIDSIRSPRSHGAGGRADELEVGKAEALLLSNHVRALLLYLGQRPG